MELEQTKKIKEYKRGYSNVYDALFKRFFFPRIERAINTMDFKPGENVLDVGVGTGLSLDLFPSSCNVVGIDRSRAMLKVASRKVRERGLDNIKLVEMDAMNLNFRDNSFDHVLISHVVSVVSDPYKLMKEVRRVCKDGGAVVVVNHFQSSNKMLAGFGKMITPVSEKIGWRSDLCLNEFINKAGLRVDKKFKLKKLDFWHLIFATNCK